MDGIQMMLKSMGIDPEKMKADFTAMKEGVTKTLGEINTSLARIEKRQELLLNRTESLTELLKETQPVLLRDNETILKLLQELTAWKRQQASQQLAQRTAQMQPQAQPEAQPPMQTEQPNA
jgi:predicted KAP-like P-loop ATPase